MTILFSLSIALFAGLMLSRVAKLVNLPAVTAYLVAGIIIGPFCLGAFNVQGLGFTAFDIENKTFALISDVALGFIAFSTYQIVQIVRTIKERKKAKSDKKE